MSTVTVFVPCYNYGRYLKKCLNSVLNQTRKPDQIFVIDDCSSDNTYNVVKNFNRAVGYIRHKKNLGHIASYNDGISKSTGDYILYLSADDWLAPTIIEKEAAILDKNPKVGLVYAQSYTVKKSQTKLIFSKAAGNKGYIGRKEDFHLFLTDGCFIPCMTALVRKTVYQKLGLLDINLPYSADHEMWARIAEKYPLAYIASPLAYYRIHGKNMHLKKGSNLRFEYEYNYILSKYLSKNHSVPQEVKKTALFNFYIWACYNQIIIGNKIRAVQYWYRAVTTKPYSLLNFQILLQPIYFAVRESLKNSSNHSL